MHDFLKYPNMATAFGELKSEEKGVYFIEGLEQEVYLSYKDLYQKAGQLCHFLQQKGVKPGDEVVIQLSNNRQYLIGFWACIFGKFIAAPLATGNRGEHLSKVHRVWEQLKKPYLLTTEKYFQSFVEFKEERLLNFSELEEEGKIVFFPKEEEQLPSFVEPQPADQNDIAYLQFSSGSTGFPKGVIMRHINILANVEGISDNAQFSNKDIGINWLPLTHDLGLIGVHISGIYNQMNQHIMLPQLFIRRPLLWIEKASEHRATILYSPNFGYSYFLNNLRQQIPTHWDLSALRLIFNGAEPISPELCANFMNILAPAGLKYEAMFPVYGLAEASLAVSFPPLNERFISHWVNRKKLNTGDPIAFCDEEMEDAVAFINEGYPIKHMKISIRNDEDEVVGEKAVGNIVVKGLNVTSGYYSQDSTPYFTPDGWFRTGDIGFMIDGRLVVTGRKKEMIIINGQNYYPHDLENIVQKECGIFAGKVVVISAWSKTKNREELIVFIVIKRKQNYSEIAKNIKAALFNELGLMVDKTIPVKLIPKTTSGKLQRLKLAKQYSGGAFDEILEEIGETQSKEAEIPQFKGADLMQFQILAVMEKVLGRADFSIDIPLMSQGLDSLKSVELISHLSKIFNLEISPTIVFEYPTIREIAQYIYQKQQHQVPNQSATSSQPTFEPIAIVSYACRLPGNSNSPDEFWDLLWEGRDPVSEVSSERWNKEHFYSNNRAELGKSYTAAGSFIEKPDYFDANFFGISTPEAKALDPQHRLLMEVCWETFENAGIPEQKFKGTRTGVFIGLCNIDYSKAHIFSGDMGLINPYAATGVLKSTASGRISYFFNLKGPSMTLDTACSSSLVAVHNACRFLQMGDCDMALAGGVNLLLGPEPYIGLSKLGALAPDGRCKTFDAAGDGYGRGEGCGMVLLKRLSDAQKDGDDIRGIILGSALNQDGRSNGLTAPNGLAQQDVFRKALKHAGLHPHHVNYLEAHGTGTQLGDPLEIQSVGKVYCQDRKEALKIGSVKSNIGHLEATAGLAGMLKVLLAFKYQKLPSNLHFNNPNPLIPWDKYNLEVIAENKEWEAEKRIAAVSSFGFSGTNAHIILKEPERESDVSTLPKKESHLLTLSAHNPTSLKLKLQQFRDLLTSEVFSLEEVCYNQSVNRTHFDYRMAFSGNNAADLLKQIEQKIQVFDEKNTLAESRNELKIAFLFSGQGSQYSNMTQELYQSSAVFRFWMDKCETIYAEFLGESLLEKIFDAKDSNSIHQTKFTQPAIFATSYALVKLLETYNIHPTVVLGHSVGEYVAACVSGVLSLEDGVKLIALRGKLMQALPLDGGMLSLLTDEKTARTFIELSGKTIAVAAVNAENQTVLSGKKEDLDAILKIAKEKDVIAIPLKVSHAFHSHLMDPILEEFKASAQQLNFGDIQIPLISNLTGKLAKEAEIDQADYWTKHIREAVRFYDSMQYLNTQKIDCVLEVGPGNVLTNLAKHTLNKGKELLSCLNKRKPNRLSFYQTLGRLYELGHDIDFETGEREYATQKVILPNYPFNRRKFWMDLVYHSSNNIPNLLTLDSQNGDTPEKKMEDYCFEMNWQESSIPNNLTIPQSDESTYIILGGISPLFLQLSLQLQQANLSIITGIFDNKQRKKNRHEYIFDPTNEESVQWFLEDIQANADLNQAKIILLPEDSELTKNEPQHFSNQVKALHQIAAFLIKKEWQVSLILGTQNLVNIDLLGQLPSLNAAINAGYFNVLERETPFLNIHRADFSTLQFPLEMQAFIYDLTTNNLPEYYAYRGKTKWQRQIQPLDLSALPQQGFGFQIQRNKTYLLTGGFGGIGWEVAKRLKQKGARNLCFVSRNPAGKQEDTLKKWQAEGVNIKVLKADVGDFEMLKTVFQTIELEMPKLGGVFHLAGIIEDKLIINQAWESLEKVFASKATGAWNLHLLTTQMDLDYFVLFSSVSDIFGNPGQSSYAAANAFLDQLAVIRRSQGLNANSIKWGPWKNTGMTQNQSFQFENHGIKPLETKQALHLMEFILSINKTSLLVADVEESIVDNFFTDSSRTKKAKSITGFSGNVKKEIKEALYLLDKEARTKTIYNWIHTLAIEVLQMEASDRLPPTKSYFEIGFDSLLLTRFLTKINEFFGKEILVISLFFKHINLTNLAEYLETQIAPPTATSNDFKIEFDDIIDESLLAEVEQMSEEDILKAITI